MVATSSLNLSASPVAIQLRGSELAPKQFVKSAATELRKLEKDLISLSEGSAIRAPAKAVSNKPALPAPSAQQPTANSPWSNQPSLIAIIGEVMALQAKTTSNYWSTLFNQGTQAMMSTIKLAPVIGNAVEAQYNAQSKATETSSSQALWEGVGGLFTAAGGIAMGVFQEVKDPESLLNEKPTLFNKEAEGLQESASNNIENNQATEEQQLQQDANQAVKEKKTGLFDRLKRVFTNKKGGVLIASMMTKCQQSVQMAQVLGQATTQVGVVYPSQSKIAVQQKLEGQAAATAKVTEQYSQVYSQIYGRTDGLAQGATHNLSSINEMWRSMLDSLTQTIISGFRG